MILKKDNSRLTSKEPLIIEEPELPKEITDWLKRMGYKSDIPKPLATLPQLERVIIDVEAMVPRYILSAVDPRITSELSRDVDLHKMVADKLLEYRAKPPKLGIHQIPTGPSQLKLDYLHLFGSREPGPWVFDRPIQDLKDRLIMQSMGRTMMDFQFSFSSTIGELQSQSRLNRVVREEDEYTYWENYYSEMEAPIQKPMSYLDATIQALNEMDWAEIETGRSLARRATISSPPEGE